MTPVSVIPPELAPVYASLVSLTSVLDSLVPATSAVCVFSTWVPSTLVGATSLVGATLTGTVVTLEGGVVIDEVGPTSVVVVDEVLVVESSQPQC